MELITTDKNFILIPVSCYLSFSCNLSLFSLLFFSLPSSSLVFSKLLVLEKNHPSIFLQVITADKTSASVPFVSH